jgi:hypothetical protein
MKSSEVEQLMQKGCNKKQASSCFPAVTIIVWLYNVRGRETFLPSRENSTSGKQSLGNAMLTAWCEFVLYFDLLQ